MLFLSALEETNSHARPDDDNGDNNNVAKDMQRQGTKVVQLQLERTVEVSCCIEQNAGDHHYQSPMDDVHNCCTDCGGGCYDDETSTFYVNYQNQTASSDHAGYSAPMLSGVQVCGPANFELLFLIDQLASTACFDDEVGSFMTLLQTATAPPAVSAFYVDSSPRIVELRTDDEGEYLTTRAASARETDDSRHDDGLLNNDNDETTLIDATECAAVEEHMATSPVKDCPSEQTELTSEYHGQVRPRHKQSDEQEKEEANDAEAQVSSFASLRHPGVPDVPSNASRSQVNKDNKIMTTAAKQFDYRCQAAGSQLLQRRRLPPVEDNRSTVTKNDRAGDSAVGLTSLRSGPVSDVGLSRRQQLLQPQQQRIAAGEQCDKYKLPDVFVDRKPPVPLAARRLEPSLGRGLRLPPVNNLQRISHKAPRVFSPPAQRRRSHPLAPRRPRTPPNRNVLASRAVWPSMASGRPVEDEWTRRAAAMKRRIRLPSLNETATGWD